MILQVRLSESAVGFESTSHANAKNKKEILVRDTGMQTDTRKFEDKCNYSCDTKEIAVREQHFFIFMND